MKASLVDRRTTDRSVAVVNGRVVTPERVIEGGVRVEADRIVDVGTVDASADTVVDAGGRLVLPGLVDLHGDDIEQQLYPRTGARIDTEMALVSADKANLTAGITTKFHAISFELNDSKNRSPEMATELTTAITDSTELLIDHQIHARCEVSQSDCVDAVLDVLDNGDADLVSVMSHIPGKGQFQDVSEFRNYYENSEMETQRLIEERSDVSVKAIRERVERVLACASRAGVATATHDDDDPGELTSLAHKGVDISEYPVTLETALRATELGVTTTMGAPNLVRGESMWGNLTAAEAIAHDAVDALVVDYHPPSLLASVFVETGEAIPRRVNRVTRNPASAVGFDDRGRIEPGRRADLIVVNEGTVPTVSCAITGGQVVYTGGISGGTS